jgi:hypothetical protein
MTTRELRQLLEHVDDTREIVLRESDAPAENWRLDELRVVWSAARAEANLAYEAWRGRGGAEAYAVYRAAEDRADAAEDTLAIASTASETVTSVTQRFGDSTNMEPEPIR